MGRMDGVVGRGKLGVADGLRLFVSGYDEQGTSESRHVDRSSEALSF
jgi:hypothetical protein